MKVEIEKILSEIDSVLSTIDEKEIDGLIRLIIKSNNNKIVTVGAGRVGMTARAFTMRLKHLNFDAYHLGDSNVPSIGQQDILIACSGSGETQTIYELVKIAKNNGAHVALITGNHDSRMGKIADTIVQIIAPSKTKPVQNFSSIQPMTTLNEQCLYVFFDALVLKLMEEMGETHETMWSRHSNLE